VRAKRVLTRPWGWALLAAVVIAAGVPLVGATLATAQIREPTLTVNKVVTGPVPPGTTFTVTVVCTRLAADSTGSATTTPSTLTAQTAPPPPPVTSTITFNAQGDPTTPGSNVIPVVPPSNCTVTETANGGAQSVSYGCASTSSSVVCETNQTAQILGDNASGENGTFTVTNAFPPPPPVVVSPKFTG
jgi:Domain of unknown function (DUF5979)